MAFEYAYGTSGDGVIAAKNFELDSTYASSAKKGDVVKFNASQKLVKAGAADAEVLGVLESTVFEGQGVTPTIGQVKYSQEAVYRTPYSGTAPVVGTSYSITPAQLIDGANAGAGKIYKVIGLGKVGTTDVAYVQIQGGTFK